MVVLTVGVKTFMPSRAVKVEIDVDNERGTLRQTNIAFLGCCDSEGFGEVDYRWSNRDILHRSQDIGWRRRKCRGAERESEGSDEG